jgi:predicted NUDIX family phosphoesterase
MEMVMVLPASELAPYLTDKGLIRGLDAAFLRLIAERHLFLPRPEAEQDPSHKQIIPYVTLRRGSEVFLLRRLKKGGETRLHGLLSIGAGGHIDANDAGGDALREGLRRELEEELSIVDPGEPTLVGIINDDTNSVGSVHLGLFFTLEVADAAVRETEKLSGEWLPAESLPALAEQMESWSQIALEALRYI